MNVIDFQELIWQKGRELYRDMPWRENTDPYYILVSELMLQQTQVDRVIPKFEAFIDRFPNIKHVAEASLSDVLILWNGLGYNRRAKFLHSAAQMIINEYGGLIPSKTIELMRLPGVGSNTAAAIATYGFNASVVFIETNIRTVYFYHFFDGIDNVSDSDLLPIVQETLDHEHPRQWYWALMDYGAYLKKNGVGRISQSAHYKKQSPLEGSIRQVRGAIIRALTRTSQLSINQLKDQLKVDDRFSPALEGLLKDGIIEITRSYYHLTK
jgi:A/G-specific adenine glycosylase